MPNFDIIKQTVPNESFRVASVRGRFDIQDKTIENRFTGNLDLPEKWSIGLIVGNSGTGKTTIASNLFPDVYFHEGNYMHNLSVLDCMPKDKSVDEIVKTFNAVGFSSPPDWLKPYGHLSNGQKMRVDLAFCMMNENNLFVFDEFTSVVDRNVAKITSFATQKAIRKTDKQFIAVTCHYDVEDWLLPDWVFDTNTMTYYASEDQKKNRPQMQFEIYETKDRSIWGMFAKYHYLSHYHHGSANIFVCLLNSVVVGFLSVLHFPHSKVSNLKKVHRLVILPDYQGIGLGLLFLNEVARIYKSKGLRFSITTSAPSLIHALKRSKNWICGKFGRSSKHGGKLKKSGSENRITASFEFVNLVKIA